MSNGYKQALFDVVFKEMSLSHKLLWFGASVAAIVSALLLTGEKNISVLGAVAGGVLVGCLAQLLLTIVIVPIAWYQALRLQYGLQRTASVILLVGGVVLSALIAALYMMLPPLPITVVLLLFVIAIYGWMRRKRLNVIDVTPSSNKSLTKNNSTCRMG